jgi:hypothetical protein
VTDLTFRLTGRGSLHARKGRLGLSIFKSKLGDYQWKIRDPRGQDRFSDRGFPTEDAALDDLEDTLVGLAAVLAEDEDDDRDR